MSDPLEPNHPRYVNDPSSAPPADELPPILPPREPLTAKQLKRVWITMGLSKGLAALLFSLAVLFGQGGALAEFITGTSYSLISCALVYFFCTNSITPVDVVVKHLIKALIVAGVLSIFCIVPIIIWYEVPMFEILLTRCGIVLAYSVFQAVVYYWTEEVYFASAYAVFLLPPSLYALTKVL